MRTHEDQAFRPSLRSAQVARLGAALVGLVAVLALVVPTASPAATRASTATNPTTAAPSRAACAERSDGRNAWSS